MGISRIKNISRGREIILLVVTLILCLVLIEIGIRTFFQIRNKVESPLAVYSEYFGWQNKENQTLNRPIEGYGYIKYSTTKYGFRVFGDINTQKKKIFVIGDSFTLAATVSDGNAYYDYLKKNNANIEIFAYGGGGYGSLQEYLILDRFYDMIKPDLIIWQWCSNDIVNNSYELESASYINNNRMVRPYYINGKIKRLYPQQDYGFIYKIIQHSYLLKTLDIRLNILKSQVAATIEDRWTIDDPLLQSSIKNTSEIMGLVRKRAGATPIVVFMVDRSPVTIDSLSSIFKKYSMYFIKNIPDELQNARAKGIAVTGPRNPHWNNTGHSIAGKVIRDYLIENKLLESG
ncbi:hypothetical protein BMS3Abin15_00120 [bacterium BMS3Abin15]|nr:hypothetical protein BMS3Abin15_00120 [bacterium BMS3Abin15]